MRIVAAAALVDIDGRILMAQRPAGKPMAGWWEFPGGKVETGEAPETALIRELREELGLTTSAGCLAPALFVTHPIASSGNPEAAHSYTGGGCDPHSNSPIPAGEDVLLLLLYLCRRWDGVPQPREGQTLRWVTLAQMRELQLLPADVPLMLRLRDVL